MDSVLSGDVFLFPAILTGVDVEEITRTPWSVDSGLFDVGSELPGGSAGKESAFNARDLGLIPGLGRSLGEGKGYTPVFWPENSMDYIVHGVTKSWT